MPKMDGLELTGEIKKRNPLQYVVILSAFNDSKYLMQTIKYGVNEYLTKPFQEGQLIDVLTHFIEFQHKHEKLIAEEKKKKSLQDNKRLADVSKPKNPFSFQKAGDYDLKSQASKNQVMKIELENFHHKDEILHPIQLIQSIKFADKIEEVVELKEKTNDLITSLFDFDGNAKSLISFACEIKDKVTIKVIELAIIEMERKGLGGPPCSFAWIGMGSEGRKSQTFHSDQDNGLIFENVSPVDLDMTKNWFAAFAEKVVNGLDQCGFPLCGGNIMATNPELCQPLDGWVRNFKDIIRKKDEKALLYASIYFDFRCIFGDQGLVDQLWEYLHFELKDNILFFRRFAENMLEASRPPVKGAKWKIFHHFKVNAPSLNIKREAVAPLDASVRLLALANGSKETSTLDRLKFLKDNQLIQKDIADAAQSAFHFITLLRVKHEHNKSVGELNNYDISINDLNSLDAEFLIDSLSAIYNLQDYAYNKAKGIGGKWNLV